jgi:hypothetical protein
MPLAQCGTARDSTEAPNAEAEVEVPVIVLRVCTVPGAEARTAAYSAGMIVQKHRVLYNIFPVLLPCPFRSSFDLGGGSEGR